MISGHKTMGDHSRSLRNKFRNSLLAVGVALTSLLHASPRAQEAVLKRVDDLRPTLGLHVTGAGIRIRTTNETLLRDVLIRLIQYALRLQLQFPFVRSVTFIGVQDGSVQSTGILKTYAKPLQFESELKANATIYIGEEIAVLLFRGKNCRLYGQLYGETSLPTNLQINKLEYTMEGEDLRDEAQSDRASVQNTMFYHIRSDTGPIFEFDYGPFRSVLGASYTLMYVRIDTYTNEDNQSFPKWLHTLQLLAKAGVQLDPIGINLEFRGVPPLNGSYAIMFGGNMNWQF